MIRAHLGETIDIHGGGIDLIFPHHENEIAQSRCAHAGAPLAHYWVHNGFVDMGAEKMSKSIGNVVTPEVLLEEHKGETLRLALLSAHYRQPLPWTESLVAQAKATLDGLYRKAGDAEPGEVDAGVIDALGDDLNTPLAMARLGQIDDPRDAQGECQSDGAAGGNRRGLVPGGVEEDDVYRDRQIRHTRNSIEHSSQARHRQAEARLRHRRPHPRRAQGRGDPARGWAGGDDMAAGVMFVLSQYFVRPARRRRAPFDSALAALRSGRTLAVTGSGQ